MYRTAPRYLSGVSVFYGDDITRRNVTGEIAFFIGQAIKGPSIPVVLSSIDSAVLLYGKNSPILKAIYEFWDGYIDSPKDQNLQLVSLRVGGVASSLVTPFGITLSTSDAYTGIEDEFYVYINSTTDVGIVKAWDKNKQKVLDTTNGINTGHLSITGTFNTLYPAAYGKDIDSDPYDTHYTLKTLMNPAANVSQLGFVTAKNAVVASTDIVYDETTDTSEVELTILNAGAATVPLTGGWLIFKAVKAALTDYLYVKYTSASVILSQTVSGESTATFVADGEIVLPSAPYVNTGYVSLFNLIEGDSELTTDPREKYELFRNALLEIEQYTPDYIVPAGIYFNETDVYNKTISYVTNLTAQPSTDAATITVDGAANWLVAGYVDVYDGIFVNQMTYNTKIASGVDYVVTLDDLVDVTILSNAASGATTFSVTGINAQMLKLRQQGYLKVAGNTIKYTGVVVTGTTAVVTRDITFAGGDAALTGATPVTKTIGTLGSDWSGYTITHWYITQANRELGIGYVKETDIGGSYTFQWSDTQTADYNLAHFGYLLANFCNESAINTNTPLCGMNVDISTVANNNYSRSSIVQWIGSFPSYTNVAGTADAVSGVLSTGSGLLGDAVMAGSYNYNRSGLSDTANGNYADPGLGLLLTAEGFIDGAISRDNFGNLVDLGKFMVAGAGLLTFSNGASITSYIDACGIYALGMLAGKPKNQGLSFSRIGQTSNTTISVVIHRKYYNDLARVKFIVPTREKGLGWVINNGDSVARTDSQYKLISTTRIIKAIVEDKRALLSSFIGKALNQYYYEAAKTKLADGFRNDISNGLINGYTFDLQIEEAAAAIGKLYLKIAINPPFELTQVTIDTVIDRAVTNA
jgi:hypothetical protein